MPGLSQFKGLLQDALSCGLTGNNRPDYRTRLKLLDLYSLERRRERYICIYVFKCINGLCPNPCYTIKENPRTGLRIKIENLSKEKNQTLISRKREESVIVSGAKLYNSLPVTLRQWPIGRPNADTFKNALDIVLKKVPDEPTVPGFGRRARTNSLLDQFAYMQS